MRVPPNFHFLRWQRFLSGLVFGIVLSWLLFLILFGMMQERQVSLIGKQKEEIRDLEKKIKYFQEDIDDINEQSEKSLLIRKVKIELLNTDKLKLKDLEKYELEKSAVHHLEQLLLNKNIEIVSKNKELLISSIENKQFTVEKKNYKLKVRQIYLYTTIELYLDVTML